MRISDWSSDVCSSDLRHLLLQPRHAHPALAADFAVVGLQFAVQQAQQGGLASAVAADQGDAFAGFDGQVDAFEQQRAADAVVDGVQGDQGHAHSVRGCRRQALCGRSAAAYICAASTTQPAETVMAKKLDKKKEEKKKPEKTLKEQRAEKKEKKAERKSVV